MRQRIHISSILTAIVIYFSAQTNLFAQTAIHNGTGSGPDNSAMLDVQGNNTGILIPRVSLSSTASFAPVVGTAVESLLIYNTNSTIGKGYYYWDGTNWVRVLSGNTPPLLTETDPTFTGTANTTGSISRTGAITVSNRVTLNSTNFDEHLLIQRSGAPDGRFSTSTGDWIQVWPGASGDYTTKGIRLNNSGSVQLMNYTTAGYIKNSTTGLLSSSATIPYSDITGVPTSLPPSGAAGGDLSGTYPNPDVVDDSHNHTELEKKPTYSWNASTNPRDYPDAVAASFVSSSQGFPSYGSVLHVRTYDNDGGTMQIYAPYNASYGGSSLRYRLGLYNNAGWTGWRTIWDDNNDGASSGMDADLLDGQDGSYYLDNTDSQTLSVGGGNLTISNGNSVALSSLGDNLGNHTATTTLNMNDRQVQNVLAIQGKDWDDNSGGADDKYRLLYRDGAHMFYNGGVVVGAYGNSTWTDLADGRLIVKDRIGIGETSPGEKLTISGGHGDTKMRLYSTGNGSDQPSNLSLWASEPGVTYTGTGIGYNVDGHPYYGRIDATRGSSYTRYLAGQIKLEFQNSAGTTVNNVLVANDDGNVGIGTASPTYKLHVIGRLRTTGINETSDARLKTNVEPISNALSSVLKMKGVTYNWKNKEFPEMGLNDDLQHGLIAQELEKIIPELVLTDKEGWKSIEYTHLVPTLIEAIKDLNALVDKQEKENHGLKASLQTMDERLRMLESNIYPEATLRQ